MAPRQVTEDALSQFGTLFKQPETWKKRATESTALVERPAANRKY